MQALFTGKLLALGRGNFPFLLLVLFVRHEENECVRLRLILNLLEPVGQVHEGVHAGEVVGEEHCMSTSVKDLCDRLEGLLAGRIPDLQLKVDSLHSHEQ